MPLIDSQQLNSPTNPKRIKQLPEKAVREFIQIYYEEYGVRLPYKKAEEYAVQFLEIVALAMGIKV